MFNYRTLRIQAMQYLFAYLIREKNATQNSLPLAKVIREHSQYHINTIHRLHSTFLQLANAFATLEKEHSVSLITPIPTPIYDEACLAALRLHRRFIALKSKYPLPFSQENIKRWYYTYKKNHTHPDSSESKESFLFTLINYFFKEKSIKEAMKMEDTFWEEDQAILYQRLRKFLKQFTDNPDKAFAMYDETLPKAKEDFYSDLIRETLDAFDEHTLVLTQKVEKWSLERINILDQLLIRMALTEINHFAHIPKKVTINEYIEIAKSYSTGKSSAFINGVIDSISEGNTKK